MGRWGGDEGPAITGRIILPVAVGGGRFTGGDDGIGATGGRTKIGEPGCVEGLPGILAEEAPAPSVGEGPGALGDDKPVAGCMNKGRLVYL